MIEDFDLIQSSFQSQYGIRLSKDLRGMKWDEFRALLCGIAPDTALGRIVQIRSEDDKEILSHYSKEQNRIRNEWRSKRAKQIVQRMDPKEMDAALNGIKNALLKWAGYEVSRN